MNLEQQKKQARELLRAIRAGSAGLRRLHARAGGAWLIVFAAMAAALTVIARARWEHTTKLLAARTGR